MIIEIFPVWFVSILPTEIGRNWQSWDLSSLNARCRSAGYQGDHAENHATPFEKEHCDRVSGTSVWLVSLRFDLRLYRVLL